MLIPVLLSWHYFDVPVSIKWQCGYHCKVTMLVLMTPVSSGNAGIVRLIYSSQCEMYNQYLFELCSGFM